MNFFAKKTRNSKANAKLEFFLQSCNANWIALHAPEEFLSVAARFFSVISLQCNYFFAKKIARVLQQNRSSILLQHSCNLFCKKRGIFLLVVFLSFALLFEKISLRHNRILKEKKKRAQHAESNEKDVSLNKWKFMNFPIHLCSNFFEIWSHSASDLGVLRYPPSDSF